MAIAILYGSTTGKTRQVARLLAERLPGAVLFDAGRACAADLVAFDTVLLGTSTWGTGRPQDHWDRRAALLPPEALAGKTLAFFGLGDRKAFPETFCAGTDALRRRYQGAAARVLAPALCLDHDNDPGLTPGQLDAWLTKLLPILKA